MEEHNFSFLRSTVALHAENAWEQRLRHREKTLERIIGCLIVTLFLVILLAVSLPFTLLYGREESGCKSVCGASLVDKQQREKGDLNPSAMLTAIAPTDTSTNVSHLEWDDCLGNAYTRGGFNYSGGTLVVPRNGIYKVYVQITYEGDSSQCHGNGIKLINNVFVIHESYPKNQTLLSSVDTVSCSMKHWIKSLHTDGSFELKANSRLWVSSSQREFIVMKQYSTFFGAELIAIT
ncbi:hypothetical protein PAMP_022751 [Pampus punctatissimus]